ncbi:MAG TPA: glycosyltransferase [Chitinophagaceae bacterium]|nr:glycosyltransferase [Chitinophagaceae bacterium]
MQAKNFLFVLWEGGGNVPPILGLAKRMIARGHKAIVISDPCNEPEALAAGCDFFPYNTAPHRYNKSAESTILRDYEANNTIKGFKMFLDHIACGPSLNYAQDVLHILNTHQIDIVVVNEALFGGCFAAEVMKLPCVMLIPGTCSFPAPGMPPPGMLPQKGLIGKMLDKMSSIIFKKLIAYGLPSFNKARTVLGLPPISDIIDYTYNFPKRVLIMTSPDFEFPAIFPANVRITGPILDDPFVSGTDQNSFPAADNRKLILVAFSTTYQNQSGILQNIIDAIGQLPYRALITLGPAIQTELNNIPPNVIVRPFLPHSQLLPQCAAVVTHAGHGTVIRSLAFGVPLICIPMGRDQTANAARVVYRAAGVRLNKNAGANKIAQAIRTVVENSDYQKNAKELSIKILEQSQWQKACDELEQVETSE